MNYALKSLKYSVITALALILGSCAKADIAEPEPVDLKPGEIGIIIDFRTSAASDGAEFIRSRNLSSTDDWTVMKDVRVYVFRSETGEGDESFVWYRPTIDGQPDQDYIPVTMPDASVSRMDGMESRKLSIQPVLPSGYYRLLAVAYNRYDETTDESGVGEWGENITWTNFRINNLAATGKETARVDEIFTGYATTDAQGTPKNFHVEKDGATFNCVIQLKRAVAGILLYVKNIPATAKSDNDWYYYYSQTKQDYITKIGSEYKVNALSIVSIANNEALDPMGYRITNTRKLKFYQLAFMEIGDESKDVVIDKEGNRQEGVHLSGDFIYPTSLYNQNGKGEALDEVFQKERKHLLSDLIGNEKLNTFNMQNWQGDEPYSLYFVFLHKHTDSYYYPLKLKPIRLVRSYPSGGDNEDYLNNMGNDWESMISKDGLHFNLQADHIYCIGRKSKDLDEPLDLTNVLEEGEIKIHEMGSYQAEVNIEL